MVAPQKGGIMFEIGDIVVPTCNNLEILDDPVPQYRIYQIGMGRVMAENLLTGETCDIAGRTEPTEYYYELLKNKKGEKANGFKTASCHKKKTKAGKPSAGSTRQNAAENHPRMGRRTGI